MIPKVFHRIFLDDPIPTRFEEYWQGLRALHPTWEFVTWDRTDELFPLTCRREFDAADTHAGRSDVLRYEIIAKFGGVYVDTDVEGLRPFDDLLDGDPFAGWEDQRLICPTVMGGEAGHPALLALLDKLPEWVARYAGSPPNRQTGPYFITRQWRMRRDVRLLPPVAFYPVKWDNKAALGGPYPPESYAVHHWAAQWLPNGPPQRT
jgi:mannosyltransferase OCH1-like enzyme